MKETKKVTLSAMMIALGVVLMALGAVIETVDLTVCALASLCVAFVYLEIGAPFTFFTWIGTSLLSWVMFPHSMLWMEFLTLFGLYPILKGYIEKLSQKVWAILKISVFNALLFALVGLIQWLLGIPFFNVDSAWAKIGLLLGCNIAFAVYDAFLTVTVKVYLARLRPKMARWLK